MNSINIVENTLWNRIRFFFFRLTHKKITVKRIHHSALGTYTLFNDAIMVYWPRWKSVPKTIDVYSPEHQNCHCYLSSLKESS